MVKWASQIRSDVGVFTELAEWWDIQPAVQSNPFLTSRILSCWSGALGERRSELSVYLLYRDGDLVAGLPLYRARGRLWSVYWRMAEPLDVVTVDDDEVREYLPRWLNRLPVANLYRVPDGSPLLPAMETEPAWRVLSEFSWPYIDLTDGLEETLGRVGKKLRNNLRRGRRGLESLGNAEFVYHPDSDEVAGAVEAGLMLEAAGWKGRKGTSVRDEPVMQSWYRSVCEVAQDAGWLRVSSLLVDDRLIAYNQGIRYDSRDFAVLMAYDEDPEIKRLSVGNLLLESILTKDISDGIERLEFGSGDSAYKRRWASGNEVVRDIQTVGSGVKGAGIRVLRKMSSLRRRRPATSRRGTRR